ncbi:MAG: recombinase RecA [Patescibacteria group bacterium]
MAKKITKKEEIINIDSLDLQEKRKMADLVVSQIRTSFGQGSILKMNEVLDQDFELISTGSLSVDLATGIGGLPKGRIIEIFGPESSGKTSLALSTIAQAQKEGGIAAYIDAEHALDPQWAAKLGVKVDELYLSQPSNGEEALEIVDNLVRSNAFDIIVVDSVAALVPKSEIEGNMGESSMGVQARLMSQALRKLTGAISKSKTTVVFINQIRLKIGVMFGNPETTTGGEALKFFASIRFDIRKIGQIKNPAGDGSIGSRVRVKIVKNKMAAPFKVVEFDMMFEEPGVFSLSGEIIDIGSAYSIIEKTGNTYSLINGDEIIKLGVGRENAKKSLYTQPELMQLAKNSIIEEFQTRRKEGRISVGNPTEEEVKEAAMIEEVEKNLEIE